MDKKTSKYKNYRNKIHMVYTGALRYGGRGRCGGRERCGEGEEGARLTWLIVIVVNPPALSSARPCHR